MLEPGVEPCDLWVHITDGMSKVYRARRASQEFYSGFAVRGYISFPPSYIRQSIIVDLRHTGRVPGQRKPCPRPALRV
jgi:hypothetical protein